MQPEKLEKKRLPKSVRKQIRESKRETRKIISVNQPNPDTVGYNRLEEFILLKVGSETYRDVVAPNTAIIREYYQIRCEALTKGPLKLIELNKEFMEKHDSNVLAKLKIIFPLITEYVGKLPR